jgi:alkylation response protein AidB-like acyl-CoA dehydrogenase
MFFEESSEQQQLRVELRAYFAELLTDEVRAGLMERGKRRETWSSCVRRLAKEGWLGVGWPTEFGGQGRSAPDQLIFFEEVRRAGVPFPFEAITTVGPTLMRHGSDEQQSFFLPRILAGELSFAVGYAEADADADADFDAEADAGADTAVAPARAVRDGSEYVVNGASILISGGDEADDANYVWLAVRTDPDVPPHQGMSILCVPTSSPGFSSSPIDADVGLSATFYEDVRIPVVSRVGAENQGWPLLIAPSLLGRMAVAAWGGLAVSLYEEVVAWAARQRADDGRMLVEQGWVQLDLARGYAELQAVRLLNWRMATHIGADGADGADIADVAGGLAGDEIGAGTESSTAKVFAAARTAEVYRTLLAIMGAGGYLAPGSPGELLQVRLETSARRAQLDLFGSGNREGAREIVATSGLGMLPGAA